MCYGYLNILFHNFLLSIHMKTQIIKLDSLRRVSSWPVLPIIIYSLDYCLFVMPIMKVNLKETFNKLIKKYSQKNAEITLIVK